MSVNLDSLITVASLLIAAYAVIPRARQLEISLRFGKLGWAVLALSLTSILYLQFYQTFGALGLTPGLGFSRWSITPSSASFLILLLTSVLLYVHICTRRLSASNIIKFREYVLELSREKKYSELLSLVEGNLIQLERLYNDDYAVARLRAYLQRQSRGYPDIQLAVRERRKCLIRDLVVQARGCLFKLLAKLLPNRQRGKDAARETLHELLINKNTVKAISRIRPYFALRVLPLGFYENNEFANTYLRFLVEDTGSVLYHEVRNNQNLLYQSGYALPKTNQLLNFLFEDCTIAKRYAVYKPIGESVLAHLDDAYRSCSTDIYNEPMGDFFEIGQWNSQLLVGIRFFDVMVTSALYQNVQWHMWLYYFSYFAQRIIRNLNPNERLISDHAEWPTKYHYVLYEMVRCLCDWIGAVDHLPPEQDNIKMQSPLANHENANIPKSSVLVLGQVVKQILAADTVSDYFKQYIMDIVFRQYFNLRATVKTRPYADAFINSIMKGGFSGVQASRDYAVLLLATLEASDLIPYPIDQSDELRLKLQEHIAIS